MNNRIYVLAGGPKGLIPDLDPIKSEVWVGVDHGVYRLLEAGITPAAAFGDFDSVSDEEWQLINSSKLNEMHTFKPEKDESDMELALGWAIEQKPSRLSIYGATGGRLDHFMANAMILASDPFLQYPGTIEIVDCQNIITVHPSGTYSIEKLQDKKYISYVPLSAEVKDLTLKGFKYPLENKKVCMGSSLCISNELEENTGTFSFSEGILMMVRSQD
ncbi:thiamine diphosphokinase [Falsibacillus pallidus]|uniref:Thiamine diphosphokinase n=1 Tax=Falsibacillus pallidus TaxID=493781 RepID=A0A370GV00_9BACI|nr:thiamine diphosphokinase [Falsibacillus pallidus]RDI47502.1 thiamine diphosphokinase [Falsibacillus pallidus]